MKDNNIISWVASAITVLTGTVAEDTARIVLLILGVLSACVSLGYNIYVWYLKAKKDGKIDAKEAKELHTIVQGGIKDVTDTIKEEK